MIFCLLWQIRAHSWVLFNLLENDSYNIKWNETVTRIILYHVEGSIQFLLSLYIVCSKLNHLLIDEYSTLNNVFTWYTCKHWSVTCVYYLRLRCVKIGDKYTCSSRHKHFRPPTYAYTFIKHYNTLVVSKSEVRVFI